VKVSRPAASTRPPAVNGRPRATIQGGAMSAAAADQPFVILARGDKAEQPCDSLAEAVAGAQTGDTIAIRGDGPFRIGKAGVRIDRALTIRAATGYRPVLQMVSTEAGEERSKYLIEARAPLTLEGLTFDRTGPHEARSMSMAALIVWGAPLRMSNCRLLNPRSHVLAWLDGVSTADIRHCYFRSEYTTALVVEHFKTGDRLRIRHCVFDHGGPAVMINPNQSRPAGASVRVQLVHNTLACAALGWFYNTTAREIEVEALGNVVATSPVLQAYQAPGPKVWRDAIRKVRWSGRQNLYPVDGSLVAVDGVGIRASAGLDTWNHLWAQAEEHSRAAVAKFTGGPRLHHTAAAGDAGAWRLQPDSPGHAAANDGHDLGADVGLVGPGPAYERWQQTPEYRQWLKHTGSSAE
jgi:hypothetical protein